MHQFPVVYLNRFWFFYTIKNNAFLITCSFYVTFKKDTYPAHQLLLNMEIINKKYSIFDREYLKSKIGENGQGMMSTFLCL